MGERRNRAAAIVVMGVSGTGKTTVGEALAASIAGVFVDGDDLHPVANRAKMASGVPLDDKDRAPWLDAVGDVLRREPTVVVACSALKRAYRDRLRAARSDLLLVFLDGPADLIRERMRVRDHAYMGAGMLDSQLATLEPPVSDEPHLAVDVRLPVAHIVARVRAGLGDGAPGA